jgi:hypothetical protein
VKTFSKQSVTNIIFNGMLNCVSVQRQFNLVPANFGSLYIVSVQQTKFEFVSFRSTDYSTTMLKR